MKIITPGIQHKEGIVIQCQCCNCIYLLNGREDIDIIIQKYLLEDGFGSAISYETKCPECNSGYSLGTQAKNLYSRIFIFERRSDWKDRYEYSEETRNQFNSIDDRRKVL